MAAAVTKTNAVSLPIEPVQTTLWGIDRSRRTFAMGLMVASSVAISFGGLMLRNIEEADPWQINFYRSLALIAAISLILLFQYRRNTITLVEAFHLARSIQDS